MSYFYFDNILIVGISVANYQSTNLNHDSDKLGAVVDKDSQLFWEFLEIIWNENW